MIKYKKTCKVCLAIKENKALLNRIFGSKFYLKSRGESLMDIHADYRDMFGYNSLINHCKKHQFQSETDYTRRHLNQLAKESERQIIKHTIESKEVFDEVIGKGMEELQAGNLRIDTKDLLNAAKLKKEFQLKEQDQQFAMMEMVYHFASGENTNSHAYDRRIIEGEAVTHYDPAGDTPEDIKRREGQSRSFYQSLAGDAPSPGSN